ncbi:MAG: ATP-dependent 6-phosphofructokinase [Acidobacteria bacterium]|nr:ATP-dependent 6-phosphofructokinase [Acidobacteriota bacterium]
MSEIRQIGVLTGGGDAPGLNAVIRAVTKSAILRHRIRVIGILDGFSGLVHLKTKELELRDVRGILPKGGTILGTTNRGNPFEFVEQLADGTERIIDASAVVKENFARLGLDALVVIGGDGTLAIGQRLMEEQGMPVVGVPKTIDNDLAATDRTFGFATAVGVATEALDRLHTTAESHHRIMLLEVMGREAGWIALHSGIAGGADVILIPEIPFSLDPIVSKIWARQNRGSAFSIVVVAEGAHSKDGEQVFQSVDPVTGWKRLGGMSYQLAPLLQEKTGHEVRVTVLGHIQRGGTPAPLDRILATRFGCEALALVMRGEFGKMVALHGEKIAAVPLAKATNRLKLVEPKGQLVTNARALGIVFGDEDPDDVLDSE